MKTANKLIGFHNVLRHARWRDDLYDIDKRYWVGIKRPAKAAAIFQAHLDRIAGRGSPQECDDVLKALTRR